MIKKQLLRVFFATLIFCLPIAGFAAPNEPPGEEEGDPDAVPIDGGLSLLLAAGVGYGVKKIHDKRKKDKENTVDYNDK